MGTCVPVAAAAAAAGGAAVAAAAVVVVVVVVVDSEQEPAHAHADSAGLTWCDRSPRAALDVQASVVRVAPSAGDVSAEDVAGCGEHSDDTAELDQVWAEHARLVGSSQVVILQLLSSAE